MRKAMSGWKDDLCNVLIQTAFASLATNNTSQPCCSHFFVPSLCVCLSTLHSSRLHITPLAHRDLHVNVCGTSSVEFDFKRTNSCWQGEVRRISGGDAELQSEAEHAGQELCTKMVGPSQKSWKKPKNRVRYLTGVATVAWEVCALRQRRLAL